MFRLISLNINDWNYLGHIPEGSLEFIPGTEIKKTALPYTTVLIGPNGTGKSTLLSYIGRIFEDLEYFQKNGKRSPRAISFPYSITYQIDRTKYQVIQKNGGLDLDQLTNNKRILKWSYLPAINGEFGYLHLDDFKFPEQVVAVSYLPMDRFRQKKNSPEDYYKYLGLRHRSNAASPQYFLNNTLPLLFSYISESNSVKFVKDILKFMNLDIDYLGIQLEYRYKQFFFTGDLTEQRFRDLFDNQNLFSKRASKSFAVEYYKTNIAGNKTLISSLTKYLNTRSVHDQVLAGESSILEFNLFDNLESIEELSLIHHLQKLDLLTSASLLFKKGKGVTISSSELSSGEFHYLTTMIAIQASLRGNSLILIDEPDTSLHPNWQLNYIENLKGLFKKWNSCHFILATHSHFIISDLENDSSEIIGLKGQVPHITARSFNVETYGASAEEVLLEIFNVQTTRNHFVYEKVGEILDMIAMKDTEKNKLSSEEFNDQISKKVNHLISKGLNRLSEEDPLKKVIDKLILKYGRPQ